MRKQRPASEAIELFKQEASQDQRIDIEVEILVAALSGDSAEVDRLVAEFNRLEG